LGEKLHEFKITTLDGSECSAIYHYRNSVGTQSKYTDIITAIEFNIYGPTSALYVKYLWNFYKG